MVIDTDVPTDRWELSADGVSQAERLGRFSQWRSLAALACSTEGKAQATAEPIARTSGLTVRVEPGLREVDRPHRFTTQGEYHQHVSRFFSGQSVPEWERLEDAQDRVRETIDTLLAATEGPLAVVSHGLLLTVYMAWLTGSPAPSLGDWVGMPMPAVAVVDPVERRVLEPFSLPSG